MDDGAEQSGSTAAQVMRLIFNAGLGGELGSAAANDVRPASTSTVLPPRASPNGCYTDLKNNDYLRDIPYDPSRVAPKEVLDKLQKGDVIYFKPVAGHPYGHAEMYCGKDERGKDLFASDGRQGERFYVAAAYKGGEFEVYRNHNLSKKQIDDAVTTLLNNARGLHGACAHNVRVAVESVAGNIANRPGDAAGYTKADEHGETPLNTIGYTSVLKGGGRNVVTTTASLDHAATKTSHALKATA